MLKNFDKKALSKRSEIEAIFFLVHLLLLAMILKFLDMEKKHSRFVCLTFEAFFTNGLVLKEIHHQNSKGVLSEPP
jgi:hypothetical protein